MKRLRTLLVLLIAFAMAACSGDPDPMSPEARATGPEASAAGTPAAGRTSVPAVTDARLERRIEAALVEFGTEVEARIRAERRNVAALGAFWTGHPDSQTMGGFVFFNDRGNQRLPFQWVPGDPRRHGRTDIGYAVFPLFGPGAPDGLTAGQVDDAIGRAMATWESHICSPGLTIPRGTLQEWLDFQSDILHAGFAPLEEGVLGVTMPFIFIDPSTGDPTDIDSDGHLDYAFAIIVYSSEFSWAIDGDIDVETVALHEAGHGLAQGHFGRAFQTLANGRIHFSPRALMNAAYAGILQRLLGSDMGGHCDIWAAWPIH